MTSAMGGRGRATAGVNVSEGQAEVHKSGKTGVPWRERHPVVSQRAGSPVVNTEVNGPDQSKLEPATLSF